MKKKIRGFTQESQNLTNARGAIGKNEGRKQRRAVPSAEGHVSRLVGPFRGVIKLGCGDSCEPMLNLLQADC